MNFNIKIKEVSKNFEDQKRMKKNKIKNIANILDVILLDPIAQTKNILLIVNKNVASKEKFDLEFETF